MIQPTPEEVAKALRSRYGDAYLTRSDKLTVQRVRSGLFGLDRVLGGGVPLGRVLEVYGPPSAGKTTLALQFAKAFQRAGKTVVWQDLEGSTDFERAESCGVNTEPGYWNFLSTRDSVITGERALQMTLEACQLGVGLVVVDSVPGLIPAAEYDRELPEAVTIGGLSRLLSRALPRITAACLQRRGVLCSPNPAQAAVAACVWASNAVDAGGGAYHRTGVVFTDSGTGRTKLGGCGAAHSGLTRSAGSPAVFGAGH